MQRDILELEKHIITNSADTESMLHLARLYIVAGDYGDALNMLKRVLEQRPHDPDVLTELGFLHQAQGDVTQARTCYRQALAQNPNHPVATLNIGLSYLAAGDLENAATALNSSIEINKRLLESVRSNPPSGPEALREHNNLQIHYLSNLALCYRGLGQLDKSLDMLLQARLLAPSDRVIAANIAAVREEMSVSSASKLITSEQLSSLKAEPPLVSAYINPAAAPALPTDVHESIVRKTQPGDESLDNAEHPVAAAAQTSPEPEPAPSPQEAPLPLPAVPDHEPGPSPGDGFIEHFEAARAAMARNDYQTAISEFVRATHFNPDHARTYSLLADAYRRTGQNEKALRAAERSVQLDGDNTGAILLLAELEAGAGHSRDAETRVAAVLKKDPDSTEAHSALCTVLRDSGQDVRATAYGKQWLTAEPDSVDAAACLILSQRARGNMFEALQALKTALERNSSDQTLLALKQELVQHARDQNIAIPDLPDPGQPPVKIVKIGIDQNSDHPMAQFPGFDTLAPSPPLTEAVLTVNPNGAISARNQPIPVPPSLSHEIKEQISAFQSDAYLAPPSFEYDWDLLFDLRSKLHGHWIFQHTNGTLYLMQPGNRPGRALAKGTQPSLSADGQALVYVSGGSSGHAVNVMNLQTHVSETLLDSKRMKQAFKVFFRAPVLSPNRKYLSVLANMGDGIYELIILDTINDTLMRPLPAQNIFSATWDANNRRVIFSANPCPKSERGVRQCLGAFNLDDGRVTWFDATAPTADGSGSVPLGNIKASVPVLSPSGKYLLVYSIEQYIDATTILNLETGTARKLEPSDINGSRIFATGIGWSPDETRLVFVSMNDVWVMDSDGNNAFPAEQSLGALPPVLWWP